MPLGTNYHLYIVTEFYDGMKMVTEVYTWEEDEEVPCGAEIVAHSIKKGDVIAFSGIGEAGQSAQPFCGDHALSDPVEVKRFIFHNTEEMAFADRDE